MKIKLSTLISLIESKTNKKVVLEKKVLKESSSVKVEKTAIHIGQVVDKKFYQKYLKFYNKGDKEIDKLFITIDKLLRDFKEQDFDSEEDLKTVLEKTPVYKKIISLKESTSQKRVLLQESLQNNFNDFTVFIRKIKKDPGYKNLDFSYFKVIGGGAVKNADLATILIDLGKIEKTYPGTLFKIWFVEAGGLTTTDNSKQKSILNSFYKRKNEYTDQLKTIKRKAFKGGLSAEYDYSKLTADETKQLKTITQKIEELDKSIGLINSEIADETVINTKASEQVRQKLLTIKKNPKTFDIAKLQRVLLGFDDNEKQLISCINISWGNKASDAFDKWMTSGKSGSLD